MALKVTCIPGVNVALHVLPQFIPGGLLEIEPIPVPERVTVKVAAVKLNDAPTDWLLFTVNVHEPVPLHVPDQPANAESVPATAVSVTCVPLLNTALQVVPQLIPTGTLVTAPMPFPDRLTLTESVATLNSAPTDVFCVRVTVQALLPLHAPVQPVKVEVWLGVAVRVICVPLAKLALQVDPQLIPEGWLVIVPLPFPEGWTVSENEAACDVFEPAIPLQPLRRETRKMTQAALTERAIDEPPLPAPMCIQQEHTFDEEQTCVRCPIYAGCG